MWMRNQNSNLSWEMYTPRIASWWKTTPICVFNCHSPTHFKKYRTVFPQVGLKIFPWLWRSNEVPRGALLLSASIHWHSREASLGGSGGQKQSRSFGYLFKHMKCQQELPKRNWQLQIQQYFQDLKEKKQHVRQHRGNYKAHGAILLFPHLFQQHHTSENMKWLFLYLH